MDNVSKEKRTKETRGRRHSERGMEKAFDRLICRWDMTEERLSEFEDLSIETFKLQMQRE
jgi:hypothetical protein